MIKTNLVDRFYAISDCVENGIVSRDIVETYYNVAADCLDMASALETSPNAAAGSWAWFDNMADSFNQLGEMCERVLSD